MDPSWYRELFRIGSAVDATAVAVRVTAAVGVPLIGAVLVGHPAAGVAGGATALFVTMCDVGTTRASRLATRSAGWIAIVLGATLGHELGATPYARELVILLSAVVAGWASGSYPGIAAVTRFFAVAAAASTGMHFTDPDVLLTMAIGGASSLAAVFIGWELFGIPPADNMMDWRAGMLRALSGADAGVRFTVCYAAAAAIALFSASHLGMQDPFWATLVVLMVMRREGTASIKLTVHYAAGTLLGVVVAAVFFRLQQPLLLAMLATAAAAFTRVGFSLNPALGFMAFTLFLLFIVHIVMLTTTGVMPHLLATRIFDVAVGCALSLAGTLAATYPRVAVRDAA